MALRITALLLIHLCFIPAACVVVLQTGRKSRVDWPQSLDRPPLRPAPSCARILVVSSYPAGVGHRVIALALALNAAKAARAMLAVEPSFWKSQRDGDAANEVGEFVRQAFGFVDGRLLSTEQLGAETASPRDERGGAPIQTQWGALRWASKHGIVEHTLNATVAADSCGIIALLETGWKACVDGWRAVWVPSEGVRRGWCTGAPSMEGALTAARPLIQALFAPYLRTYLQRQRSGSPATGAASSKQRSDLPPELSGSGSRTAHDHSSDSNADPRPSAVTLSVVWHIRLGDIQVEAGGALALRERMQSLAAAAAATQLRHLVLSETHFDASHPVFGVFYNTPGFAFQPLTGLSVADSFLRLTTADVLIHTGSSFATAAALAAPTGQVYLYSAPKEEPGSLDSGVYRVYRIAGESCIPWQVNGSLSPLDARTLTDQLRRRTEDVARGGVQLGEFPN